MKKFIVIGNWKLHGNNNFVDQFIIKLKKYFLDNPILYKIVLAPPLLYVHHFISNIREKNFFIGAQNVDTHISGSYTGEISVDMLQDNGIKYVIIGHSERRHFHNESNEMIAKKFSLLKKKNMVPILCIGETLEEKKQNKTQLICSKQIDDILKYVGENAFKNAIIAYEPIWAIGSGYSAQAKEIQNINNFIKNYISDYSNVKRNEIITQYGGSVDDLNIEEFFIQDDIDGVLLGGASISCHKFIKILHLIHNFKI